MSPVHFFGQKVTALRVFSVPLGTAVLICFSDLCHSHYETQYLVTSIDVITTWLIQKLRWNECFTDAMCSKWGQQKWMGGWIDCSVTVLGSPRTKPRDNFTFSFPYIAFSHNFLKYHEKKPEYWIRISETICTYGSQCRSVSIAT
jgi:hypothetical protein